MLLMITLGRLGDPLPHPDRAMSSRDARAPRPDRGASRAASCRLGLPGALDAAHLAQDRRRRARLPAGRRLRAARGGTTPRCCSGRSRSCRRIVGQRRDQRVGDRAHDRARGAAAYGFARLRFRRQEGARLLHPRDPDAAAGRAGHPLLPAAQRDRLDRHLPRPRRRLSHLLAAVRDLAHGVLLRGHPARDGGGRLPRPRQPFPDLLARHPAAGREAASP